MGLLKQDHNAIQLDLRAAIVLYPKRLSKNGQFKPVVAAARATRDRACSWKSLCMRGSARVARDSCMRLILRFSAPQILSSCLRSVSEIPERTRLVLNAAPQARDTLVGAAACA